METVYNVIRIGLTESLNFGLWEEGVRRLLECNERYGGMLMMVLGDPFQLAVVGHRKRLYDEHYLSDQAAAQHGRRLYDEIKNVIYLEENMRFADDIEWGDELGRARCGEWTPRMKEIVRSRYTQRIAKDCTDFDNRFTQVITSDNATRQFVNSRILKHLAATTRVYMVPARIGPGEVQAGVFGLLDSKTQGLPAIGYYYPGMPIRMKVNQCLMKGVANGMMGQIHHIEWPRDTDFSKIDKDGFCRPTREPRNIFVDIPAAPSMAKDIRFPDLNTEWPSTVMPIYRERKPFKWGTKSMHITQFPIVPGVTTTCYGGQGATYDSVCVANLRPSHYRTPDTHSLYVALSRVRQSKHLIMMEEVSDEDFDYFRPSEATIAEDNRLRGLHVKTIDSFNALMQSLSG